MRTGEGAALITKQNRFQHCVRQSGTIDRNKRLAVPFGGIVEVPREDFLASACRAHQHHRHIAGRDTARETEQIECCGITHSDALLFIEKARDDFRCVAPIIGAWGDAQRRTIELAFQRESVAGLIQHHNAIRFQLAADLREASGITGDFFQHGGCEQ